MISRLNRFILPVLISALAGLAGCSSYPFGMPKAVWESLSPAQQSKYRTAEEKAARQNLERQRAEENMRGNNILSRVLREEETYRGKVRR